MSIYRNKNLRKSEIKLSRISPLTPKLQKYLYVKYMAYTVIMLNRSGAVHFIPDYHSIRYRTGNFRCYFLIQKFPVTHSIPRRWFSRMDALTTSPISLQDGFIFAHDSGLAKNWLTWRTFSTPFRGPLTLYGIITWSRDVIQNRWVLFIPQVCVVRRLKLKTEVGTISSRCRKYTKGFSLQGYSETIKGLETFLSFTMELQWFYQTSLKICSLSL